MAGKKQNDKLLDAYLKGEPPLSEMYQAASDELPPAELDQKILKQAKQATRATSVVSSPFSSSWMVPASWAAALLLSVGLSLLLPEEEAGLTPAKPRPPANGTTIEQTRELQDSEREEARLREVQDIITRSKTGFQQPGKSFMPQESLSGTVQSRRRNESTASTQQSLPQEMEMANVPKTFAEKIKLVKPGMSKTQLRRLLGDPVNKTPEIWVYNDPQSQFPSVSAAVDKPLSYSIYFENGKVAKIVPGDEPVPEE